MRAMVLKKLAGRCEPHPLELLELPVPEPKHHEVRLRVVACGVCHTELDEIEGRTPPRLPIVLGHEVVGIVDALGPDASSHRVGDRVGVGWIHSSDGSENENLSAAFRATGRDENGGYAEYMIVPERYAYPIPKSYSDVEAAPLLCAGAIGYRALKLTQLRDGKPLGLTGFGGSGHICLQIARSLFPNSNVYVFARDEKTRAFACELGANWAGDLSDQAPEALSAIVDTTPAWKPIVEAMNQLAPGGRLVVNAIRKEDDDKEELLRLDYARHLWLEKEIKSVANITGRDIADFLALAEKILIRVETTSYPLENANDALATLRSSGVRGACVLVMN
jgi:alcohol dehydrogenase, propanol-preferring